MPLTAVQRVTRWRKKHRDEYNEMRRISYKKNNDKEILRKKRSYYWNKESQRFRNILLDF